MECHIRINHIQMCKQALPKYGIDLCHILAYILVSNHCCHWFCRVVNTKQGPTFMACLDARQDRLQVSHTQIPIRTKALLGDLIHCGFTWKTQRSTFLVCDKTEFFTCTFTERSRILNIDSAPVLKIKGDWYSLCHWLLICVGIFTTSTW